MFAAVTDAAIDWDVRPTAFKPLDGTGHIALLALDMIEEIKQLNAAYVTVLPAPLEMRFGVHFGNAVGGIIGVERPQ